MSRSLDGVNPRPWKVRTLQGADGLYDAIVDADDHPVLACKQHPDETQQARDCDRLGRIAYMANLTLQPTLCDTVFEPSTLIV